MESSLQLNLKNSSAYILLLLFRCLYCEEMPQDVCYPALESCKESCRNCLFCHPKHNCQVCYPGYYGNNCSMPCNHGMYGESCLNTCDHCHNFSCNAANGICLELKENVENSTIRTCGYEDCSMPTLVCLSNNCHTTIKNKHWKMHYYIECDDCTLNLWRLYRYGNSVPYITNSNRSNMNEILFDPVKLDSGLNVLRANVGYLNKTLRLEKTFFLINGPHTGSCHVHPEKGDIKTTFNINCAGWKGHSGSSVMYFEISTYMPKYKQKFTIYKSPHPVKNLNYHGILPAGNVEENFTLNLMVQISDEYSATTEVTVSCVVTMERNFSIEAINNLHIGNNEEMIRNVGLLVSVFNSDMGVDFSISKEMLRLSLETLQNTRVTTVADLKTLMTSTNVMVQECSNFDIPSMVIASNTLCSLFKYLHSLTENMVVQDEKDDLLSDFIYSSANTLKTLLRKASKITETRYNSLQLQKSVDTILNTERKLAEMVQSKEGVKHFIAPGVDITAGKKKLSHLVKTSLKSSYGSVQIIMSNKTSLDKCVKFSAITHEENPYMWDKKNTIVSAVLEFRMSQCEDSLSKYGSNESNRDRRSGTSLHSSNMITLLRATEPNIGKVITEAQKPKDKTMANFHATINISDTVFLYVAPISSNLQVYLQYNKPPTYKDYYYSATAEIGRNLSAYFETASMPQNVTSVHVGVESLLTCEGCDGKPLEYYFLLEVLYCNVKYANDEEIATCSILKNSTKHQFNIQSIVFGAFNVEKITEVNTIDFSTIFTDFDKKLENSITVIWMVFGGVIFSIILAIILKQYDKKDAEAWHFVPVDTSTSQTGEFHYEFFVHTGEHKDATTLCDVYINFIGENGHSKFMHLANSGSNFKKDTVSGFYFSTETDLALLKSVQVKLGNSEKADEELEKSKWYLDTVVVAELSQLRWAYFQYDNYISEGEIVELSHGGDSRNKHSFWWNCQKKAEEEHIWLSVIWRGTRSQFTRVQRFSVCVAYIYLYMLTSAMWFNTERKQGSTIDLRGAAIVVTAAAAINFVVTMAAMTFFNLTEPQPKDQEARYMTSTTANRHKFTNSRMFVLPYWCMHGAYALIIFFVLQSAFICVLYSLQWGKYVSNYWLVGVLFSQVFSMTVLESGRIVLLCLVLRYFYIKDASIQYYDNFYGKKNCTLADGNTPEN